MTAMYLIVYHNDLATSSQLVEAPLQSKEVVLVVELASPQSFRLVDTVAVGSGRYGRAELSINKYSLRPINIEQ